MGKGVLERECVEVVFTFVWAIKHPLSTVMLKINQPVSNREMLSSEISAMTHSSSVPSQPNSAACTCAQKKTQTGFGNPWTT